MRGNEATSGAKQNFVLGGLIVRLLENATHWHSHDISDREFLATDIEGIESIGADGAVFEEVILGFGELLACLVLAEAVAPSAHSCRLDGKDKVVVVGAVEEWHETLFASEALVDEQIPLVVAYRVVKVDGLHLSAVTFKLVDGHENPTRWCEILVRPRAIV